MKKRDLKEYIVKLNDRNIQRQRESGFTLYAIAAAIIYCIFFIIDNIKIAYNIDLAVNLNLCVFTANLLFIMSLFHIAYLSSIDRTYISKIFPYQEPLSFDFDDLPLIASYGIISILNFYSLKLYDDRIHLMFLWVFAIIPLLNVIFPIAINIYKETRKYIRKRKKQSSDAIDFTYHYKLTKRLGIGLAIYSMALISLYIYTWIYTIFDVEPEIASGIIKFTLCFFSLLYLLNLAIEIYNKQNYNHLLEEFEKEIFFENIDNEEIARRSESMFFGIPIKKWLANKEQEIITFFDERRKASLLESVRIASINQMTDSEKVDALIQAVKNGQTTALSISKDYIQKINRNFNDLDKYAYLDDDEAKQLSDLLIVLNAQIRNFNKEHREQLNAMQRQLNNFLKKNTDSI